MRCRGVVQEFLLDGVPVEPGDGAQPPGDGGAGPAVVFRVAGEGFDVGAADGEQRQRLGAAPGGELPEIESVRLAGEAAVSGQVSGERKRWPPSQTASTMSARETGSLTFSASSASSRLACGFSDTAAPSA
ncbi:MAG TPA: hypothetical protein VF070_38750 [Streptosporangiaceae bacterium]